MLESRLKHTASCTICVALALFFGVIGLSKLVAPAAAQRAFIRWGHPDWFHLFVGALELMGALLLVNRRTSTFAAAILAGVALSAVATHLRSREFVEALLPAALLIPIAGVGYCRRLDATWMRHPTSRRRAIGPLGGGLPPSAFPDALGTARRPSNPARRARLRITPPHHADIPDPLASAARRERRG